MTSGSAARRRRASQARRAEQARESGISLSQDRYGRRVLTWTLDRDPWVALSDSDRLRAWLEKEAQVALVQQARDAGYTWAEVGEALGVTRQAAHGRFGDGDG